MSRKRSFFRWLAGALALAFSIWLAVPGRVAAQPILVAHLPSTPIEAASRHVAAITALADYLAAQAEDLRLETKVFRRAQDARDFLADHGERVALLLADTSLLIDLPAVDGWEGVARFSRAGSATYRRLLVVQAGRQDLGTLTDLRGGSLSVVETSGGGQLDFVKRSIFAAALDPASWFGTIDSAVDDFLAMVSVLYGETDAALVSEHNPLLKARLDEDLRVLYTSPPLSLPVLCRRRGQLSSSQDAALVTALRAISGTPNGREVLAALGFDGFEMLRLAPVRESLAALEPDSNPPRKALEIALPRAGAVTVEAPTTPLGEHLQLILSIELPEIPLTAFEPSEKP